MEPTRRRIVKALGSFVDVSQTLNMVILRPTRKLRSMLPATATTGGSDTALGDWYVNRIVVDHQPLLLLVSSTSLLPMLLPARDVRGLPRRLASIVEERLKRCGVANPSIDAEIRAMNSVVVRPTTDRSVLGIMVDFAKAVPYHLEPGRWDDLTLRVVEDRLAETPCHAGRASDRVIFPETKAPELLRAKWLTNTPLQPTSGRPTRVH
jgi:hypothetical protein